LNSTHRGLGHVTYLKFDVQIDYDEYCIIQKMQN